MAEQNLETHSKPNTQPPQPECSSLPLWMRPSLHLALVVVLFCAFALPMARYGNSAPSFTWSWVYAEDEFIEICQSWDEIQAFYRDLRVPIPPIIAGLEILSYRLSGGFELVTIYLYRALVFFSFFIAIVAFKRGMAGYWWSAAQAMVFVWATVKIHPLNPQIYDLWVPCFFLLYLFTLRQASEEASGALYSSLLALLSGLCLAFVETARPFVFVLLPFLIVFSVIRLSQKKWRLCILFLIPILLLSGGWHLKLYLYNDGQVLASNNSGFNLRRCWEPVYPLPETAVELEYGWKQYNNPRHIHASNQLKSEIIQFILENPFISAKHTLDRIAELFKPMVHDVVMPLQAGIAKPMPANHPWLSVYVITARLSGAILLICFVTALRQFLLKPSWRFWGSEAWILIFFTATSILILAVGESGEDYRFLISVLPCLAAVSPVSSRNAKTQKIHVVVPLFVVAVLLTCFVVKADYDKNQGRLFFPDNVALLARAEVSSTYGNSKQYAINDGIVAGHPGPVEFEWTSNGEKEGAWAKLIWDATQTVDCVQLYDRPNSEDQIYGGMLFFSDYSFTPFFVLENTAQIGYEVRFEPKQITSMKVIVNQVKPGSPNIGFAEIAVFQSSGDSRVRYDYRENRPNKSDNLALSARVTASSRFVGYSPQAAADGFIEGAPANPSAEWASAGEGANAWLRLEWDEPQQANRIQLFDRPNLQDQIFGGVVLINDHIQYTFGTLLDDASQGLVIEINETPIHSLQVVITSVKPGGPNIGLSEVSVYLE